MSKVNRRQFAAAVLELLQKGTPAPKVAQIVAAYLVDERRTGELDALMREVAQVRAQDGVQEAILSSAFDVDIDVLKQLEQIIANHYAGTRRVIIRSEHKPELLGGVRLETMDLRLDLTVHNRLRHLSQLTINTI